jgi:hypothetical protein
MEFSFATVFALKHHVSAAYVIVLFYYCMVNMSFCFFVHIVVPQNAVYLCYSSSSFVIFFITIWLVTSTFGYSYPQISTFMYMAYYLIPIV